MYLQCMQIYFLPLWGTLPAKLQLVPSGNLREFTLLNVLKRANIVKHLTVAGLCRLTGDMLVGCLGIAMSCGLHGSCMLVWFKGCDCQNLELLLELICCLFWRLLKGRAFLICVGSKLVVLKRISCPPSLLWIKP